jgi:hypothetical protein
MVKDEERPYDGCEKMRVGRQEPDGRLQKLVARLSAFDDPTVLEDKTLWM